MGNERRVSVFGSPFHNTNSGIIMTNDKENRKRIELTLNKFWKSVEKGCFFKNNYLNYYRWIKISVVHYFYFKG